MLGKLRLVEELGRGGMGIVWLAEVRGPGGFEKRVVVKELRPELARDASYRTMFLEEARLAARLHHKNIVQTYQVAEDDGRWLMILEHLEGATLADTLELVSIPLAARVRIVAEVLAGLHHAHELRDAQGKALGVVHRDVSPRNVFVTLDGEVKLLDFGVAKCRDRARETQHGVLKGAVAYMTPDHVAGGTIDRRADVFAAGVLLRELLTGTRLWGDLSDVQVLRRLMSRELPPFPAVPAVPADLRAIAERAMAKDRADRFPTADAMRDALERWLEREAPRASLGPLGAALGRALAARTVTLPASDLVTATTTRGPVAQAARVAIAGALGLLAMVGVATTLLHDAAVTTATAAEPAVSVSPVELSVPPVVPSIAEPKTAAADEPAAPPETAPKPYYEPDSI